MRAIVRLVDPWLLAAVLASFIATGCGARVDVGLAPDDEGEHDAEGAGADSAGAQRPSSCGPTSQGDALGSDALADDPSGSGCGSETGALASSGAIVGPSHAEEDGAEVGASPGASADDLSATEQRLIGADSVPLASTASADSALFPRDGTPDDAMGADGASGEDASPSTYVFRVNANDLVDHENTCRVWLDAADSELSESDLLVKAEGSTWPADTSCLTSLAWYLQSDADGTWLTLCPVACQVLRLDPMAYLEIHSTVRTGPALSVK